MVPFDVSLETIARFLNCEIADHPVYDGLEVQWFDDPRHGRGMLAFLTRRDDGRADFYYQPTLTLDPATFYVGAGIGRWGPAEFHAARLELSSEGVLAEVRFDDAEGRAIALHVDDRGGSPRRRCRLLAPVSAAIAAPPSMMLVYLRGFDLVQARGTCRVAIGGQDVSTGRLPLPWLHGRRLVKVSDGLTVVHLNRAHDGPRDEPGSLEAEEHGHRARLVLDPPLPPLQELAAGRHQGRWHVEVDGDRLTGGTWTAEREGDEVTLGLEVTVPWPAPDLPPLIWAVTRLVSTFRQWPTTYRWQATVRLDEEPPRLQSAWSRTGDLTDAYRKATGA